MEAETLRTSRIYRFDNHYLLKQARTSKSLAIFLVVAMACGFAYFILIEYWPLVAVSGLGLILILWLIPRSKKLESRLQAKMQAATLWFDSAGLHATTDSGQELVPLTAISSVVLQKSRGSTVSIVMFLVSGAPMKWSGLEEMDAFGNEFLHRLSPDQVKVRKWIHR